MHPKLPFLGGALPLAGGPRRALRGCRPPPLPAPVDSRPPPALTQPLRPEGVKTGSADWPRGPPPFRAGIDRLVNQARGVTHTLVLRNGGVRRSRAQSAPERATVGRGALRGRGISRKREGLGEGGRSSGRYAPTKVVVQTLMALTFPVFPQ